MRIIVQRTSCASVKIDSEIVGEILQGLVVLVGIESEDTQDDAEWLIQKIINLRIFNDENGKMNLSNKDIDGSFLVISQFTLHASTKKGNRPSYIKAAPPEFAISLYNYFVTELKIKSNFKVETVSFGADMKVSLIIDGPLTISIDSKNKE
jgi:D-tyrosyl-tRNA(Tyr) deacylase